MGDLEESLEPSTRDAQLMAKIILKLICDGKLSKYLINVYIIFCDGKIDIITLLISFSRCKIS